MPKWSKDRDYYADLELPPSAQPDEIKRQFKKLALKYHPDRNPGKEAEVNPKFQTIQLAHEILVDETLKRRYDDARKSYTSRYPGASGVQGNPWQNAAKAYPPPPRRQPNPSNSRHQASGAQRYEHFASNVPRYDRSEIPRDDPQFRRSNADAWDHIRSNTNSTWRNTQSKPTAPGRPPPPPGRAPTSAARDSRPVPTPVPPPRTAYQKQKADAAFGTNKKTGFTPRSASVADEPPVTNKNYFTNRTHSNLFTVPGDTMPETVPETAPETAPEAVPRPTNLPDPIERMAPLGEQIPDNRQRTPYRTPGGEKTSLFDSTAGLGRSTSTRAPPRSYGMPGAFPHARRRSSSPARSSSNDGGSEDSIGVGMGTNRPTAFGTSAAQSKAGERYRPDMSAGAGVPPQPAATYNASIPNSSAAQPGGDGPSVYASDTLPTQVQPQFTTASSRPGRSFKKTDQEGQSLSHMAGDCYPNSSSEENHTDDFNTLFPFEAYQRQTIDQSIRNGHSKASQSGSGAKSVADGTTEPLPPNVTATSGNPNTDSHGASSFNFTDEPNATGTGGGCKSFTRNSTESINTRFVDPETFGDWQFTAGSASANEAATSSRPRPQSRNRPTRRQTPMSKPSLSTHVPETEGTADKTNTDKNGFSAGAWDEQIGSKHFEPQSTNNSSTSPTRRANLKKSRSFKMTTGTAAVVDEEESEEQPDVHRPSLDPTSMPPDAMDIDTPPVENREEILKPAKVNGARKYSTEPHRADWRAGDVNGIASNNAGSAPSTNATKGAFPRANVAQPASGSANPRSFQHGGSEDTEEFRTTISDFKNVEPFIDPSPSGLKSFADLKSNLPFQSKPSEQLPSDIRPPPPGPLQFPSPPVAPRLPPTMGVAGMRPNISSFNKYAQDFNSYMDMWESFNNSVLAHFMTRQEGFRSRRMLRGANWLESAVPEYLIEINQDLDVQQKYVNACTEHQKRIVEFMEFRDRVK
ncbi:hypothetical protein F4777DRAFT_331472 [Nemania sp. FL0916]|nr:hypothetical protein F4777DRAFT_331472 [Nemania sp. FL0916]